MNVNSLGSTGTLAGTSSASALASTSTGDAAEIDDLFPAAQSSVSEPGSLFGQLATLAQSDPDEFKKVAAQIAQKLKDAAANATGDQAKFLSGMADKFSQAAQTGDMSVLKPDGAQGASHHHHHKHGTAGQPQDDAGSSPFQQLTQIISAALQDQAGTTSTSQG